MARVFVTRTLPFPALERLRAAHEVREWPGDLPPGPDDLRAHAREADALLTLVTDPIGADVLDAAPDLKAIANMAVGTDNIDVEAAAARGIAVGNTPDVLTDATADLAFALLLALARGIVPGRGEGARRRVADVGAGRATSGRTSPAPRSGSSAGGGSGRPSRAAPRASGCTSCTARAPPACRSTTLLERADFVSVHTPLTPETRHLIGTDALARMKPTALLVNTSRGGVVDQDALRAALHAGEIAGAALDVTDPEPLPADHPLLDAPNLLVVPHIGSATVRTRARMAEMAVENLLAALDGQPMPHPVA